MSTRAPIVRALIGLGLVCAAVLALASSIVLHGAALLAVGGAAVVVAWVAYAVRYAVRDDGRHHGRDDGRDDGRDPAVEAAVEAAWKAAVGTVSVIVLVSGVVVLAGGAVAVLVSGLAVVSGGAVWLVKTRRARHAGARASGGARVTDHGGPAPVLPAAWPSHWRPPVTLLPTSVLGSEWLETTSALARPVEPAARQEIVRRRQETLDELERRDPAGFERWLAAGAAADSDPAAFVRGDRTTGSDAA